MLVAMPQSLSCLIIHVVFSTKDRAPLLDKIIRPALYSYMATVIRNGGCECFRIGGVADHVHIAFGLSRTVTLAQIIEQIKTSTSKWLKTQPPIELNFSWQRGYGAFSVARADLEQLLNYIDVQETHHQEISFLDEYRRFLERYKICYDEDYVWD